MLSASGTAIAALARRQWCRRVHGDEITMQQNQNDPSGQGSGGNQGQQQNVNATSDQPGGPGSSPSRQQAPMSPGDDAPAGTPGTGENVCPCCGGSGRMEGDKECAECGGTGKVTVGIGGA
jgi:RecJ-like exonuclease